MDRKEKIARLQAWLKEYDTMSHTFGGRTSGGTGTMDRKETFRTFREFEAVRHELHRQEDKRIVEELGLFDK